MEGLKDKSQFFSRTYNKPIDHNSPRQYDYEYKSVSNDNKPTSKDEYNSVKNYD